MEVSSRQPSPAKLFTVGDVRLGLWDYPAVGAPSPNLELWLYSACCYSPSRQRGQQQICGKCGSTAGVPEDSVDVLPLSFLRSDWYFFRDQLLKWLTFAFRSQQGGDFLAVLESRKIMVVLEDLLPALELEE